MMRSDFRTLTAALVFAASLATDAATAAVFTVNDTADASPGPLDNSATQYRANGQ